jgi:hypothetical protein
VTSFIVSSAEPDELRAGFLLPRRPEPASYLIRPKRMKTLTSLTVIVLAVAGIAACGTPPGGLAGQTAPVPGGSATAARTASVPPAGRETGPSPSPTLTGPARLGEADNGATVRLSPGQTVTVVLQARGMLSWHIPAATGTAARRTSAAGGYPGQRPARATFIAVQRGSTTLRAINDAACLHAQPACLMPQQIWQVTVAVS